MGFTHLPHIHICIIVTLRNRQKRYQLIKTQNSRSLKKNLNWLFNPRKHFSCFLTACRYILRKMLSYEPDLRPSIPGIRKTDWMCKPIKNVGESSVSSLSVAAGIYMHQILDYSPILSNCAFPFLETAFNNDIQTW